ncbi:MAG TPA: C25 family cysteine peptidase [Planctomycetota bacterium]|nr:C25 family cysteine peptidase [Planctomycetota bacterium]
MIALLLIALAQARASTTNTWQGTTDLWATPTNWSAGHIPLSTEDVVFPPINNPNITVPAGALANSLTFNGSYQLSGGDLTCTTGKINVATGQNTLIYFTTLAGSAGLTVNTGTGSAGTLRLNAPNTFTGTTTVSGGTLEWDNPIAVSTNGALGNSASAIVVGDASTTAFNSSPTLNSAGTTRGVTIGSFLTTGTYTLSGSYSGTITTSQSFTFSGPFIGGGAGAITSATLGTHTITFAGGINFNASGAIGGGTGTFAIVISNPGGTVTLSGANTFTGGVTLNSGTLTVGSAGALGASTGTFAINGGTISASTNANTLNAFTTTINSDFTLNLPNSYGLTFAGPMNFGTAGGTSRTVTVSAGYIYFDGVISNSTNINLVKAGAGSLTLAGNNTFNGGVTLNAGTLELGAQGTSATNSALGTGPFVIAGGMLDDHNYTNIDFSGTTKNAITINGDFSYVGSYNLNLGSGAVSLGSAGGASRTITVVPQAGALTLGGPIANGTAGNSLIVTGYSSGGLRLAGNNTFTGGVTVSGGILHINAQGTSTTNSALGTGPLVITGGSTIDNSSAAAIDLTSTTNNAVTIDSDFGFIGTQNLTLGTGPTTLGTAAGTYRNISVDAGTLGLGPIANGTTANSLVIYGGNLALAGAGTLSGTAEIATGRLTLTGSMASVSAITVDAGSAFDIQGVAANPPSPGRLSDSAVITLSGGTLSMEALGAFDCTEAIGSLVFTPGTSNSIVLATNSASKCQLTAGGALPTLTTASVFVLREATGTGTANLFFSGQSTDIAAPISGYTVNSQAAKYDATSATPQGLAPQTASNVHISAAAGAWGTATTWVNGAVPAAGDTVIIRHAVSLGAARSTEAVIFDQGNGSLTGAFALTNSSGQYTVLVGPTGSASSTISAIIASTSSVIKNGPGTLTLSAANTYTGATTINEGTLKAGSTTAFGSNSAVTLANAPDALLDITGFNLSIGSLTGGGALGGNITLGLATLTIGGDNTSPAAYAGIISDSGTGSGGSILKTGTGTLTLTGANTYFGNTTINAGVLSTNLLASNGNPCGIGSALDTSNPTLFIGNATLQYTGPSTTCDHQVAVTNATVATFDVTVASTTLSHTGGISNPTTTGGVTKIGAGTLELLNQYSAYTGVTKISAGTLSAYVLVNGGLLSSIGESSNLATNLIMDGGTLRVESYASTDRSFTITAGKTATFDAPAGLSMFFSGAAAATTGNVVKTGPGTLTFGAAQKYTGTTTVNGGTLQLNGSAGAIASSPTITLNSGTTLDLSGVGSSEPASPGRIADTATVTLNGATLSMEAGTTASRLETVGTLAFTPGSANTIILAANAAFKCQLTSGGTLPTLSAGTTVSLIRNVGTTGTANLFYSGQATNIAAPITGYTVNYQSAKYDATSATPQGLIQSTGNIIATAAVGNWGTAATWVGNAVPAPGDTVVIRHAVTLEAAHTSQAVMFDYVGTGSLVTGNQFPLTNTSGIFTLINTTTAQVDVPVAGTGFILNGTNGTLNLTDIATYTGTTTINSGMAVQLGYGAAGAGALGSGPIVNNGTLKFNNFYTEIDNDISGSGGLYMAGSTLTLGGNNTFTGPIYLEGTLQIGNGGTTGTLGNGPVHSNYVYGGGDTLNFNRSDSIVIPNAIGDANGTIIVEQISSGTTTLTGTLYPNVEAIAAAGNLSIASGPSVTVGQIDASGGTITIPSGTTLTVSYASATNAGNIIVPVGATLTSTGSINVSGSGTLSVNGTAQSTGIGVSGNGTLIANGTVQSVTLSGSTAASPAGAGCLLRGTGSAGAVLANDSTNVNGVVWPGLAKTVGALTANEQLTVDSLNFTYGGKLAVLVKNSGGFSQNLVVTNSVTFPTFDAAFSFATDTTPAVPTSYTVLTCTYGSINESLSTIDAPPGFALGTHYDIRYSISGASPKLHSVIGPYSTLGGGYNQMDLVFTGNSVTPVTLDSFAAQTDGLGARLDWHCVSEFQNAGFNLYRRAVDEPRSQASGWTRVNPALIPGRITNPDAKLYEFYDWTEPGVYEYKLESVNIRGSHETYRDIAGPVVVDFRRDANMAMESLGAATASIRRTAFRAVDSAQKGGKNFAAPTVRVVGRDDEFVVQATRLRDAASNEAQTSRDATSRDRKGAGNRSLANTPPAINSAAAARWFSAKTPVAGSSFTAAKIVYNTPGVLLIPQAMLPAGFDMNHVAIQRDGRALTALAKTPAGLVVFGEGYEDDYTDKDALFLRTISGATAAGAATQASGLFASALPVNTQSPMTATAEFHDVYFDFNLRPYNYPPWFSSQYLTDGTDQSFSISAPNATGSAGSQNGGAGSLIVNVWSLTPDHTLHVAVNGQSIGQAQWSGGDKLVQLAFQIPSGVLNPGANQIDLITPATSDGAEQIAFLHSMSLSYNETLDASQPLTINNLSVQSALYEVGNLPSANAWVVDARFPDRAALLPYEIQAQGGGTFKLRFIGSAGGTGQFLVVPAGQEHLPMSITKRAIVPLKAAPYLAVGPNQFASGVQPLLAQRSKEGLRAAFVDQEQIFDYYNYGRYGPAGIQNAVRSVRPQFLLLVGRTTYDYRNYSGLNVDPLCPAFLVSTTFWAQATSDSLFGDLGRGYPEVAVGRLPVNDAAELRGAISHTLAYPGLTSSIRVQATADLPDPAASDFAAEADSIAQANPELAWQRNYYGQTVQTLPDVSRAMTEAANGSADVLLYVGHGNAAHLGQAGETILDSAAVQQWTGNVVFLQATCTGNWMAKDLPGYQSLAMQALSQPQGGISASIGTSTYLNSQSATEFMSQLLANTGSSQRWGSALLKAQQWASQQAAQSSFYSDLLGTEQIFGDPALPIFSTTPSKVNAQSQPPRGNF